MLKILQKLSLEERRKRIGLCVGFVVGYYDYHTFFRRLNLTLKQEEKQEISRILTAPNMIGLKLYWIKKINNDPKASKIKRYFHLNKYTKWYQFFAGDKRLVKNCPVAYKSLYKKEKKYFQIVTKIIKKAVRKKMTFLSYEVDLESVISELQYKALVTFYKCIPYILHKDGFDKVLAFGNTTIQNTVLNYVQTFTRKKRNIFKRNEDGTSSSIKISTTQLEKLGKELFVEDKTETINTLQAIEFFMDKTYGSKRRLLKKLIYQDFSSKFMKYIDNKGLTEDDILNMPYQDYTKIVFRFYKMKAEEQNQFYKELRKYIA